NFTRPPLAKFSTDAATLLLCNFDDQYDIFTGCSGNDNRISWLPVHRSTGGEALIANDTLANISLNGKFVADGVWIYGAVDSLYEGVNVGFARRGLYFWGGGTFQNRIYDAYLNNSQFCILGASGALGVTTFLKPHCNTNAPFPFYWQNGSVVMVHPETSPNQGVITNLYFDGSTTNNMTVTLIDGAVDNEVPNTAYLSDLTLRNVSAFNMVGGSLGALNLTQPVVRIIGGGALNFQGTNFAVNPAAPSVFNIVSNPRQPVLLSSSLQQGGTNVPWCNAAKQCAALNNSVANTTNLAWAISGLGVGAFAGGVDISGTGDLLTSRSGNTSKVATAGGAIASGNCARWDSSGNLVDSGGLCGGGTPGGSTSQLQYNNAGAFAGIANLTSDGAVTTAKAGADFVFADPATPSKHAQLDLSNITAAATRTINVPDANATLAQPAAALAHQFVTA